MLARILNRSRLGVFSAARTNNITARLFSNKNSTEFNNGSQQFSDSDELNYAIAEDNPPTAKVAFNKGRGLEKLGKGYAGEALNAFELAEKT